MGNILIENISKSYKNNLVLDNISLKFESGRVYGLIGKKVQPFIKGLHFLTINRYNDERKNALCNSCYN